MALFIPCMKFEIFCAQIPSFEMPLVDFQLLGDKIDICTMLETTKIEHEFRKYMFQKLKLLKMPIVGSSQIIF